MPRPNPEPAFPGRPPRRRCARTARAAGPLLAFALLAFTAPPARGESYSRPQDWQPMYAAVGACSTVSTGALSLRELAQEAARRGLDAVLLADLERNGFEYGFPPLLPLIRIRPEGPSVSLYGLDRYLEEVRRAGGEQGGALLVAGLRLRPHYYWSGSPLAGNLTLHNADMGLCVLGFPDARGYRRLPVIDGQASLRYGLRFLPYSLGALFLLAGGAALLRSRRPAILLGAGLLAAGLSGLTGYHPLRSSLYDAYHGDQGAGPYQEVIRLARQRGGIVTWAAPEAQNWSRRAGPVTLAETPSHADMLLRTSGYTAFEALYGDRRRAHLPGETWDQVLREYCRGERLEPVWAVGSGRFQRPGESRWLELDGVQTVFLVRKRTQAELLDAYRRGRMYAVFQGGGSPIRLEDFSLTTGDGRTAVQGEELGAVDRVRLWYAIRVQDGRRERLRVQLIRSGLVLADSWVETPVSGELADAFPPDSGKFYYRLRAQSARYEILSNPIFVSY